MQVNRIFQSYTRTDWLQDFLLASSNGIDGFILNIGRESWEPDRIATAFNTVRELNFKLCISFDMTSLSGSQSSDFLPFRKYVQSYGIHPNYARVDGKPLVTTFSGEHSTFGTRNPTEGWKYVLAQLPPVCGIFHFNPNI